MDEKKKYLKWYQMLGYGVGDLGSNCFYTFLSSFVMLYLTNQMGLNSAIAGTLMMVSKFADGVTDVFFGKLMDATHTKMGRARPWYFWSCFPLAILEIMIFAIPGNLSTTGQYVWFFLCYTAANAFVYTANAISYSTLSILITKNSEERVALGSFRYVFALLGAIGIASVTMGLVGAFGGGAAGWRMTAIIMSVVQIICVLITTFSAKEVDITEPGADPDGKKSSKTSEIGFVPALKILFSNKYYLLILVIYITQYLAASVFSAFGIYYCTYILDNAALLGTISMTSFAMILGLFINPFLVKKLGLQKTSFYGGIATVIAGLAAIPFGFAGALIPVLAAIAFRNMFRATLTGSMNAIVADISTNIQLKNHVSLEGMLFSCSSVGIKVGSGIGTALCGWILAWFGFNGQAADQTSQALFGINFGYFIVPVICYVIYTVCLGFMNVAKENQKLAGAEQ